ncbi:hypothetical protein [Kushneria phosphatilytica]|uniref:Uncharacterized protein n=1 Tax=Kushneria phosphatilytica TaxID=657387 RepID=A0A1S1NYX4_9GAMM|nr:hypothetical protein [Kushneria phosphatilytica]OHV12973.1 hypothetical protein BH688_02935 [Kushneria phosphatilytica]QEL10842.1 hypothetical protein FY550_06700 [Kushneria phosphatilytica]
MNIDHQTAARGAQLARMLIDSSHMTVIDAAGYHREISGVLEQFSDEERRQACQLISAASYALEARAGITPNGMRLGEASCLIARHQLRQQDDA